MKNILTIIILTFLLTSCSNTDKPARTYLKDKNIYAINENGTEKQLTFNGTDSGPILIKDNGTVIFVRTESNGSTTRKKLMKVSIKDLVESVLTDQKPYIDWIEGSHDIFNIDSPTLSLDGKYVLFIVEKWATANELVKVDIKTGQWTELFTAESFEELGKEPYKGYFLAGQSDIEDRGRDIYFRLLNDSGRIIKKFGDEESMKEFRAVLK
ncbi:MAG: hypothetical protein AAB588_02610 [Patescibacteria group bacterium]